MRSVTSKPFILSVIKLSVTNKPLMLNVIMLNVIMLNVVAPFHDPSLTVGSQIFRG